MRCIGGILSVLLMLVLSPAHAMEEKDGPLGPSFVTVDQLIFSVMDGRRVTGLMSVTVKLHLHGEGDRNFVENLRPKLRDRYLFSLTQLGAEAIDITKPLHFDIITTRLQRDTDQVLGDDIAELLITDMTTRAR